jgi:radical SAM protein with 4Fe4S-binding SPASM domain
MELRELLLRSVSYCRLKRTNFRIKKSVSSGNIEPDFGPSSLNLMMIDTCNSQCLMCGKDYRACGSGKDLSLGDIKKIYNHLKMNHIVDVIYGGGGEPFLNMDLAAIAEYTHEHFPVIQHTVISNFLEWKPETVARLVASRVHFLISVNAASKETFRKISGVDAFDRVVENIKNLLQLRRKSMSRIGISLSMILMRQNIGELCDFIKLASMLDVDEVKTLYVRIYPEKYRKKRNRDNLIKPQDSLFYHQKKADEMIRKAEHLSRQLGMTFCHEPLFQYTESRDRNCDEPWKSLFINFNGDVYPCPASEILFKPKVDSRQYNSGNIIEQPIEEIWNNSFWKALRKTNIKNGRKNIIPECSCCGNSINWWGVQAEKAHLLDWEKAEKSNLRI